MAGVQPAAGVAEHQTPAAVVVETVQVNAGAIVFGLIDIGVQVGVVGDGPVHRGAQ